MAASSGLGSQEKPTSALLHLPSPYSADPSAHQAQGAERSPCSPPGHRSWMGTLMGSTRRGVGLSTEHPILMVVSTGFGFVKVETLFFKIPK